MAFIAPLMSLTAACDRSVRVASGASRLCASSSLFFELGLFIAIAPLFSHHFELVRRFFRSIARTSSQSHCPERIRVEVAGDTQTMAPLVTPKRLAHLRAERSIAFAAIIAFSRESLLRCDNRRVV